jgi:flap endonuclease-1
MVGQAKRLLDAMGVPWVQAPSEGEAQCACMCKSGQAWAAASQDMDSIAFGSPRLVRNLASTGRRKLPGREKWVEISTELVELDGVLSTLGITHDQFIIMGILIGTDYNPGGIEKIGPKRALALVKEKKTLEACMAGLKWKFEPSPQEIFSFFKNPPVCECRIISGRPDAPAISRMLVDEHGFAFERVSGTLDKLERMGETPRQRGLGCFLKQ